MKVAKNNTDWWYWIIWRKKKLVFVEKWHNSIDLSMPPSEVFELNVWLIFSTLEPVGSMSGTLRVNASDEAFRITAQKFTDVKLENEKKS